MNHASRFACLASIVVPWALIACASGGDVAAIDGSETQERSQPADRQLARAAFKPIARYADHALERFGDRVVRQDANLIGADGVDDCRSVALGFDRRALAGAYAGNHHFTQRSVWRCGLRVDYAARFKENDNYRKNESRTACAAPQFHTAHVLAPPQGPPTVRLLTSRQPGFMASKE